MISKTDPEIGETTIKRDILGRLISKTVNNHLKSVYSYDALGRLLITSYTTSSGATEMIRHSYDGNGRVTNISSSNGDSQWVYQYDSNGNCTLKQFLLGKNLSFSFKMQYDANDHLVALIYPNNDKVSFARDSLERIQSIGEYIKNIAYFPNNQVRSFFNQSGLETQFTESDRDLINGISVGTGDNRVLNKQYTYDANGNVLSIVDGINNAKSQQFSYDSNNRLVSANGSWGAEVFTYDDNNNLLTKSIGQQEKDYHYDHLTGLLSSVSGAAIDKFTYKDGVTVHYNGLTLSYNSLDQLESVNGQSSDGDSISQSYTYDGNSNLYEVESDQSLIYQIYNKNDQLLYSISPTSGDLNEYVYLDGRAVVDIKTQAGKTTPVYLHHDLLGSLIAKTDSTGKLVYTDNYKPYGESLNQKKQFGDIGYAGKSVLGMTGFSYYGARFYSPDLGRFLSPDPSPVRVDQPITFNRYIYAGDNPVTYEDNNGKWIVSAVVGGLVGLVAGYYDAGAEGALIGGVIGGAVGFIDPLASSSLSSLVARFTSNLALRGVTKYGSSIAINATGNVLYSRRINHSNHFSSEFFGSIAGVGIGHFFDSLASGIAYHLNYDSGIFGEAVGSLSSAPVSGRVSNWTQSMLGQLDTSKLGLSSSKSAISSSNTAHFTHLYLTHYKAVGRISW